MTRGKQNHVIVCRGLPGYVHEGLPDAPLGSYLMAFDIDFMGGLGQAFWTDDLRKAMRFYGQSDALAFWRQPSKLRPLRADGRLNRPLCAYSIEIRELVPDGKA